MSRLETFPSLFSVKSSSKLFAEAHKLTVRKTTDRASAYSYWVPELSAGKKQQFPSWANTQNSIIVKAGYLVRSAFMQGDDALHITADFNATTAVEVIGAPKAARSLHINGDKVPHDVDSNGIWKAVVEYREAGLSLPDLEALEWKYVDSLPELRDDYDDSTWPKADHENTDNNRVTLATPTSLLGSDYGFNTGYLVFRGRFTATGNELSFGLQTQGGAAFGHSVWLNGTLLGSWRGQYTDSAATEIYGRPAADGGRSLHAHRAGGPARLRGERRGRARQHEGAARAS